MNALQKSEKNSQDSECVYEKLSWNGICIKIASTAFGHCDVITFKIGCRFQGFDVNKLELNRYLTSSLLYILFYSPEMGDYYTVLQCDKTASAEEIKRSYQRLLLSSHPDKSDEESDEKFLLIQKAWSVLREPESRKQYDATLTCQEHSEVLLYDSVLLSDMTFVACEDIYKYSCRCGGTYVLENSKDMQINVYIGCDECSFSILVKR